jgi:hypothetical protein
MSLVGKEMTLTLDLGPYLAAEGCRSEIGRATAMGQREHRLLLPAAVEFDLPSRLSAQAGNGHPSTTCGGRWPGLSPGHDGNEESRSTAADITSSRNTM